MEQLNIESFYNINDYMDYFNEHFKDFNPRSIKLCVQFICFQVHSEPEINFPNYQTYTIQNAKVIDSYLYGDNKEIARAINFGSLENLLYYFKICVELPIPTPSTIWYSSCNDGHHLEELSLMNVSELQDIQNDLDSLVKSEAIESLLVRNNHIQQNSNFSFLQPQNFDDFNGFSQEDKIESFSSL